MISLGLVKGTDSVNPTADAYKAKSQELQADRDKVRQQQQADSDRKDAEMLRVFELAGDGFVNEAQYFAQTKGIQVPQEVYSNATLAKGLTLAGKIYPGDPAAAQKFTQAWMTTQGDMRARLSAGQQAAGVPVNPEDRMLQRQISLEQWKLDHAAPEMMTPYQQAQVDLDRQRLEFDKTKQDKQNLKDNYITADGIVYSIQPDGNLVQLTNPQDSGIDIAKESFDAYQAGLSGFSPENAEENALNVVSFGQKVKDKIAELKGTTQAQTGQPSPGLVRPQTDTGVPASGIRIDPLSASNAAIARQQENIGANQYQTNERKNLVDQPIPAGLPPGSVYIGTSNGYPVYQDPQGNRYINDGSP